MAAEIQTGVPGLPAAGGDYDWTGFHLGAHVDDSLVERQR